MHVGLWPAITRRAAPPLRPRQSRDLRSWAGSGEPPPAASSVAPV